MVLEIPGTYGWMWLVRDLTVGPGVTSNFKIINKRKFVEVIKLIIKKLMLLYILLLHFFSYYKHHCCIWLLLDLHDDKIAVEGMMNFLDDLGLNPESRIVLLLAWKLKAATQCEFTRDEFVNGLLELGLVINFFVNMFCFKFNHMLHFLYVFM